MHLESGLGRFDAPFGKAVLDEFLIFISWHPKQPSDIREVYIGFFGLVHEKNPAKMKDCKS